MEMIPMQYPEWSNELVHIKTNGDFLNLVYFEISSQRSSLETILRMDDCSLHGFEHSQITGQFETNKENINRLCRDINTSIGSLSLKSKIPFSHTEFDPNLNVGPIIMDFTKMDKRQQSLGSQFNTELFECEKARNKYDQSQKRFTTKRNISAAKNLISKQASLVHHLTEANRIIQQFLKQRTEYFKYILGKKTRMEVIKYLDPESALQKDDRNGMTGQGVPTYLLPMKNPNDANKNFFQRIISSLLSLRKRLGLK